MKGIGIDLAKISRFKSIKKGDFERWKKTFTKAEWEYAFQGVKSAEHLAGIFAAKESAMKAKKEASTAYFKDWEVKHEKTGAPELFYKGKKAKASLSISHDAGFVIAAVVIF